MTLRSSVCDVADIEIRFESSGVRVRPVEINSYEKSTKYDYARIRVTQEAGQHIQDNHNTREPVSIVSNETTIARYMIVDKEDTISFTDDSAYIRLEDPLKILSYTTINKKFHNEQTLEDVVDWIFNRALEEDKHGVLTEWSTSDEFFDDISEWASNTSFLPFDFEIPIVQSTMNSVLDVLTQGKPVGRSTVNMDFEDENALSALKRVARNYGVSMWNRNSVLLFGSRNYETNVFPAGLSRDYVALVGLSAPSVSEPIERVTVRGSMKRVSSIGDLWDFVKNDGAVRAEAVAVRTDLEEGEGYEITVEARTTFNGETLEGIARRKLLSTIGNNTGNCTVDVLSTTKSGIDIKEVKLGDAIYIPEYKNCRRPIEEGFYEVTGIHHKVSNWVGWHAILDLRDMNSGSVNTESYFFDPSNGEMITDEPMDGTFVNQSPGS